MEQFNTVVALIGVVIIVASLLSNALDRTGIPLSAVFLALGAILGPYGLGLLDIGIDSPALRVLATLGLALVLFSDAVTTELIDIRTNWRLLIRLLGPGTLVPAAVTAVAGWLLLGLSPAAAALIGAALASTDAILLRRVLVSPAVPSTVRLALRLESGMNDIVLLPIVILAMTVLATEGLPTGARMAKSALSLLLLGPAIGAAVGWFGVTALTSVRSRGVVRRDYEALYALALAFIAYAAAESAGGSGFVAAFAAGLTVGAQDVELCDCFLEYGEATSLMLLLLTFVAFGTSLIWTGFGVIDMRTLAFAAIALTVRTFVLFALLPRKVPAADRRLIALLGPRGISSLLLSLLPVFEGMPGAERLFTITCLVVLLSILLHGTGMAILLRNRALPEVVADAPGAERVPGPGVSDALAPVPERISIEEFRRIEAEGESVVLADVRTERSYRADPRRATGALRLNPDDPVRAATALRLPRDATLVLFCA
ncbi:MAG: cation:proton antiporter [Gemmatimonadota bacterium]